jgi:hypothetical protein
MSQQEVTLLDLSKISPKAFKSFIKRLAVDYELPFLINSAGDIMTMVGDDYHKTTLIWDDELGMWQPLLPKSQKSLKIK